MLYRGMDRAQLDAAYNNTAAVSSWARSIPRYSMVQAPATIRWTWTGTAVCHAFGGSR